ncbi:Flp family type IVb pilin [Egicoccus sp. AB-alg6-2]
MCDENGASSVEYGLLLAGIAAALLAIVATLGADVLELFQAVEGQF